MRMAVVWGANGYIGSNLIVALVSEGWCVRAVVRSKETLCEEIAKLIKDVKLLTASSNVNEYIEAFDGAEVIFNCIGEPSNDIQKATSYLLMLNKLAEATSHLSINRIVHLSTVAVYGQTSKTSITTECKLNGSSVYAKARIEAERIMLNVSSQSTKIIVVRIPMVVGKGMRSELFCKIYNALKLNVFLHPGTPDAKLNCIGIHKLVNILTLIGKTDFENSRVFQFSDAILWTKILDIFSKCSGRRLVRLYVPPLIMKLIAQFILKDSLQKMLAIFNNKIEFVSSDIGTKLVFSDIADEIQSAIESSINANV